MKCAVYLITVCLFGLAMAGGFHASAAFNEPSYAGVPSTQTVEDPFFGDYEGTYAPDTTPLKVEAVGQVVPEGGRVYRVVLRARPLDPKDWPIQVELMGKIEDKQVVIAGRSGGPDWKGAVTENGQLKVEKVGYHGVFELKRVVKKSPTEGQKPPAGAVVLVPYNPGTAPDLNAWKSPTWMPESDGTIHKGKGDIETNQEFGDCQLHMEFRPPYEPHHRGQARGNSGVFFNGLYEIQVLDSWGIILGTGDAGGLYAQATARIAAAFPPLSWQTYDITFRAPRFDASGKKSENARITVVQNGVKVLDDQEIASPTGTNKPDAARGPIKLQDHGNLVLYRNIWLVEQK